MRSLPSSRMNILIEGNAKLWKFCTPVTAYIMKDLLKGAWMDNWTMHSWFQILKKQAASSYFFECALSDWYVHDESSEKHVQNSFGLTLLDNMTEEFLFFPIDWINERFMQFGWSDPTVWTKHRMECPMQTNIIDCGIFVIVYAKHIALSLPIEFTKSDMYYYRAKIVNDLYIEQYARWKQKVAIKWTWNGHYLDVKITMIACLKAIHLMQFTGKIKWTTLNMDSARRTTLSSIYGIWMYFFQSVWPGWVLRMFLCNWVLNGWSWSVYFIASNG